MGQLPARRRFLALRCFGSGDLYAESGDSDSATISARCTVAKSLEAIRAFDSAGHGMSESAVLRRERDAACALAGEARYKRNATLHQRNGQ